MAPDQVGLLALAVSAGCAVLALLAFVGDALERWAFPEDVERRERTSEPPMWRHPMTRPGRRS